MIALYKQVYSLDSSSLSSVFSHWAGPWQLVQLISSFSPVSPFISLGVARNLFGTLWCLLALVCLTSPHHRGGVGVYTMTITSVSIEFISLTLFTIQLSNLSTFHAGLLILILIIMIDSNILTSWFSRLMIIIIIIIGVLPSDKSLARDPRFPLFPSRYFSLVVARGMVETPRASAGIGVLLIFSPPGRGRGEEEERRRVRRNWGLLF